MLLSEANQRALAGLKRRPLELSAETSTAVFFGQDAVRCLLPHRPPMEFIHEITAVDLGAQMLEAVSRPPADSPVFAGHFPGNPVYPGVYQIETMGQAALCLAGFVKSGRLAVPAEGDALQCLFTRVHDAGFLRVVRPSQALTVRAKVLECDEFTGCMAAQILVDGQICAYAALEAHFL